MAINQPLLYLVSYDICDPRRLARVHRFLREEGLPLQYSVFFIRLTAKQVAGLSQGLEGLIERHEDDVRIYPLLERGERVYLGQQLFPEDIFLFAAGGNLLP